MLDGTVKAVRVADRLPWRELYEAHAPELASYLLRLTGDREVASDLMQETFVVGMRDERALREPASARAWLYTIASRLGTKWLRRRRLIAFLPFLDTDRDPQDALAPARAQLGPLVGVAQRGLGLVGEPHVASQQPWREAGVAGHARSA